MSESVASAKTIKANTLDASLVEGSLWRAIWIMSWPLLLTTVSNSLVGLVDIKVAMRLGSASQAAVGIAEHVVFLFIIFLMAAGIGTTAIVSRAAGAGDEKRVALGVAQSINVAIFLGVILTLVCSTAFLFVIRLLSPSHEIGQLATTYLKIYSFILLPSALVIIINAAFRAAGNARTPLLIMVIMTIVNILGDFLTVYCNWPIANLGIRGIAWSGLVSTITGSIIALYAIKVSDLRDSLKQILPMQFKTIKRILKIGIPSAFQRLSWALSLFVIFFILKQCPDSTFALAALAIGMRCEALLFMPLLAFSLAVSAIVGQNLGAGENERAFKAGWHVAWLGVWLMIVLGSLMFLFARQIAGVMSNDPATIHITASYLRINALSEPLMGLGMILSGAMQGAGDTRTPMWITIITQWFVRLPCAWLLAIYFKLGPQGAWLAMATSICCMAVWMSAKYQSRGWIKVRI